jgi:hypothetical protein
MEGSQLHLMKISVWNKVKHEKPKPANTNIGANQWLLGLGKK